MLCVCGGGGAIVMQVCVHVGWHEGVVMGIGCG